jgi:hypothetical protein
MKKTAILLSIFFIGFSQAQTPTDKNTQTEYKKKETEKKIKSDPDARVFVIQKQKKTLQNSKSIMTKENVLKNKEGYKRVNRALKKETKVEKRKERKSLRTQNRMFNKYIKQSKKKHRKIKRAQTKALKAN